MIAAGRRSKTSATALLDRVDRHGVGAEGLDEQADRVRLADRVRDLRLAAAGQAGGHDVLGHPAHGVRRGAVDLGRVLAGERAAAVPGHAAVGVDDDLAAGQAGVAHRAADLEAAGRVDQQPVALGVRSKLSKLGVDDVLLDVGREQVVELMSAACWLETTTVSSRTGRSSVVLDGDLGLAVRPQVGTCRPCGPRTAGGPAGAPARSAAASAPGSRRRRSRTSCPGRRRPAGRASSPTPPARLLEGGVDALGDVRRLGAEQYERNQ